MGAKSNQEGDSSPFSISRKYETQQRNYNHLSSFNKQDLRMHKSSISQFDDPPPNYNNYR